MPWSRTLRNTWILAILTALFALQARADTAQTVTYDRSENGVLYFNVPSGITAPSSVKADLFDVAAIGTLGPEEGSVVPYFLFVARPCPDCARDRYIYAVRPGGEKPVAFVHPGKIVDPKTGQVILESRAFYGRCLRNSTIDQYVVFQKERVDRRRKPQTSLFIAEPHARHLSERLVERGIPALDRTLKLVRKKLCHEISGSNRMMVRKAFDLRSRSRRAADAQEDEEEDDSPKENQTDEELSTGHSP